jgi:phage shock protein A
MGIFTRMRDIVSSNINAMLDKAEDPEKLLRLMIQEMEDTLIEIKAQCASVMAQSKTFQRQADESQDRADQWGQKAELAVSKNREDLAREALLEKRRYQEQADGLALQRAECDSLIEQYQNDIQQLEAKIQSVRERQKVLLQRHAHATAKKRAEKNIRHVNNSDVLTKFDAFQRRIDHLEAEADLVNYGTGAEPSLEQQFQEIEGDEELEKELDALRGRVRGGGQDQQ